MIAGKDMTEKEKMENHIRSRAVEIIDVELICV